MEFIYKSQHFDTFLPNPPIEKVGQKAANLLLLPKEQTPPFIVLSTDLYTLWKESVQNGDNQTFNQVINNTITASLELMQQFQTLKLIARSSATVESLDERGTFDSKISSLDINDISGNIVAIFNKAFKIISDSETPNNQLAILIQGFVKPILEGHLSNERRVSKTGKDWIIEYSSNEHNSTEIEIFQFNIEQIKLNSLPQPTKLFKSLLSKAISNTNIEIRSHFEWIWDGKQIFIVQQDNELITQGNPPGSEWLSKEKTIEHKNLFAFVKEKDAIFKWSKALHVKTFRECGLPHGEIFILENSEIIKDLIASRVSTSLGMDLKWLTKYPIVIRTSLKADVKDFSNLMLPRTDTLFTYEKAIEKMKEFANSFKQQGLSENDFAFLIHRFILSKSCAFSYARPNESRVKIDSSWGFADGLGYNPYDSFEVDKNEIQKRVRCKSEYLDVDQNGKWLIKKSGSNWDWKQSLSKDEIFVIRDVSLKVANFLNKFNQKDFY